VCTNLDGLNTEDKFQSMGYHAWHSHVTFPLKKKTLKKWGKAFLATNQESMKSSGK